MLLMLTAGCFIQRNSTSFYSSAASRLENSRLGAAKPSGRRRVRSKDREHLPGMLISASPRRSRWTAIDAGEPLKGISVGGRKLPKTASLPYSGPVSLVLRRRQSLSRVKLKTFDAYAIAAGWSQVSTREQAAPSQKWIFDGLALSIFLEQIIECLDGQRV